MDKEAAKGVEAVFEKADTNVKEIESKVGENLFGFPQNLRINVRNIKTQIVNAANNLVGKSD